MDFYSIASGSGGNCIYVGAGSTAVLIDAGISCRRITDALASIDKKIQDITAILITHEHSDHIAGLGVLSRKIHAPIYATAGTLRQIRRYAPLGVVDEALFCEISADTSFVVGDLTVYPFHISHDAADPVAYRLSAEGKSVAVATDMGRYDDYTLSYLRDLDAVLLESNHDEHMLEAGPYPYHLKRRIMGEKGHLSNTAAGRLLCEIMCSRMKAAFLGHLSKTNNYDALAYATVISEIELNKNCPFRACDIPIRVASREKPTERLEV